MRYISRLFQPVITIPKNAKIKNTEVTCKSQKLLLENGLIHPTSSGLFALLPLARRALDKLEALIRSHLEHAGAQRLSLPALAGEQLWEKTERLEGAERIMVVDRHNKRYLLAPTHEESISDLLANVGPLSYKQFPLTLYQISNKYRDEHRPKHGLLRAREFSMMDAYSAHSSEDCAKNTYEMVSQAYRNIFVELNLPVHRVKAPSGEMGGTTSHEWQLLASAGEDLLNICPSCSHAQLANEGEARRCECGCDMDSVNSVEVGHTFVLGTRYSQPLHAMYTPPSGVPQPIVMACYGIGITRLLAACIEALSSDTAMRWPRAVAPYSTIVIGPKRPAMYLSTTDSKRGIDGRTCNTYEGSKEWEGLPPRHIESLSLTLGPDVIIDDRHHLSIGKRLLMADKMGYPKIVIAGKSALETPPKYEVYTSLPKGDHKRELLEEHLLMNTRDDEEIKFKNKV